MSTSARGYRRRSRSKRILVADQSPANGPLTARRVAENEARVRKVNEEIEAAVERLRPDLRLVPFVCECGHPACIVTLRLPLEDYNAVRNHGRWFICSPGHELTQAGHERIIETRDGFVIVEKQGEAAEVAERLDPRAEGQAADTAADND